MSMETPVTEQLDRDKTSGKPAHTETLSSSTDLVALLENSGVPFREIRVASQRFVYRQEETDRHVYLIKHGYLEVLIHLAVGQETIIDILGAGALCGEGPAFDGSPRLTSARALTDTTLLRFQTEDLCDSLGGNGALALSLFNAISIKQRMLLRRLSEVAQLPPEKRVLRLLVQLSENSTDGSVNISHDRLARLIGLTRVTVTRAIGKLQKRGEVVKRNGKIVLASHLRAS